MTDEQIIKALECCQIDDCKSCPLSNYDGCKSLLFDGDIVIDLIKRQKAEIKRLENAYKQCAWERDTFLDELKTAKSEAISEYKEKVKAILMDKGIYPVVVKNALNEAEKEMVGENDV